MNQRNVEALAEILMESGLIRDGDPRAGTECLSAAELLTSRGVLVPSALTDEDCRHIAAVGKAFIFNNTLPANFDSAVAAKIERIAKGEEAHSGV